MNLEWLVRRESERVEIGEIGMKSIKIEMSRSMNVRTGVAFKAN